MLAELTYSVLYNDPGQSQWAFTIHRLGASGSRAPWTADMRLDIHMLFNFM
jgi:hypothetical protein